MTKAELYRDQLVELRSQKKTLVEIADALNLSKITVSRYLKELGLSNNKASKLNHDDIIAEYNSGMTANELAKKYQVSHGVISRLLKSKGIELSKSTNIKKHFNRVHNDLYDDIKYDRDKGMSLIDLGRKYHMRYQNVKRLLDENGYQKDFVDDFEPLKNMRKCANKSVCRYLDAIESYIDHYKDWPSNANLADWMNLAPMTVSDFVRKNNLKQFLKDKSESNYVKRFKQSLLDLGLLFEINNRQLLDGYEIDVWIPSLNLGFEINPATTHSIDENKWGFTDREYHQKKSIKALEKGIALVHLYDWDFQEPMYSKILFKLKCMINPKQRYGARELTILELSRDESNGFLEKYHFQGAEYNSGIRYGLVDSYGDIKALMTFGKSRFTKDEIELIRYCVRPDVIVMGGFDKLLSTYTIGHQFKSIISYMDLNKRFVSNSIYDKKNFVNLLTTTPNYRWVQRNTKNSLLRYDTMKSKLIKQGYDSSLTEIEIMRNRNYIRVFDAGSLKYELV